MARTIRNPNGYWTCKVRRKKCDQSSPVCASFTSLDIQCYYGRDKPIWMDSGRRQQDMAEQLKVDIKRNARRRRAQARIQGLYRDLENSRDGDNTAAQDSPSQPDHSAADDPENQADHMPLSPVLTPPDPINIETLRNSVTPATQQDVDVAYMTRSRRLSSTTQKDFELSLLMSYLDYAFPVLFPFYRPSVLEGGRAWLLTLALQHPAFYHNVVGLAAYFYCAVPVASSPENDACAVKAQTELQGQMEKAVQGIQNSLGDVNRRGVENTLSDSIHLLENIVQLVNFETAFASSENWQIHLTAAVDLFSQTLQHHGRGNGQLSMAGHLLEKLRCNVPLYCSIWSADQAAFRFFAAIVVYQDIIASTALERAPSLFNRYSGLLADTDTPVQSDLLNLEEFVGCQTWVLASIAKISSLNEWKKKTILQGDFDILTFVSKATTVQKQLQEGIARIGNVNVDSSAHRETSPYRSLETILTKSGICVGNTDLQKEAHRLVTKAWAYAAQVNMPDSSPAHPGWRNFWHAEITGCGEQFSKHGNLKPCGMCHAVDEVLNSFAGDLQREFPEARGHFNRDSRVIINGYKVCSYEP